MSITHESDFPGKLFGLGLGPGAPELLTQQARRIIETSDVFFIPEYGGKGETLAGGIIRKVLEASGLPQAADLNSRIRTDSWREAYEIIVRLVQEGKRVVYASIGDPSVYSNYHKLVEKIRKEHREFPIETIPGISSISLAAAVLELPLAEGDEDMCLISLTDDWERIRSALILHDTVVFMKIGKLFRELVRLLGDMGYDENVYVVRNAGAEDQEIRRSLKSVAELEHAHCAVLIAKKRPITSLHL